MDDDDEIDPNYLLKMFPDNMRREGMRFIVGFMDIIKKWCYLLTYKYRF